MAKPYFYESPTHMEEHSLEFRATNGYPIRCRITLYRDIPLVIASETGEGMSVTNAAEIIATEVVKQYGVDPARMLFMEHYPESQRPRPYGESYDLVTFTWDGKKIGQWATSSPIKLTSPNYQAFICSFSLPFLNSSNGSQQGEWRQ